MMPTFQAQLSECPPLHWSVVDRGTTRADHGALSYVRAFQRKGTHCSCKLPRRYNDPLLCTALSLQVVLRPQGYPLP
ncbi:hypothetical protein P7K49_025246, partial [Saguinus oedipus]